MFDFLCLGYVRGGQYVRFGWHLWLELLKNVLFHSVVYFSVHGQEQSKQMWNRSSCVWRGSLVEAI